MSTYMILESKPLTKDQVDQAIKRAHEMRSEATWTAFINVGHWFSQKFHSITHGGSDLAHSA